MVNERLLPTRKLVRMVYPGSYEHGAVTVISENCFPGIPSPNTGLFAEAFLQMGYWGIIVFPAIYAYILKYTIKHLFSLAKALHKFYWLVSSCRLLIFNFLLLAEF